MNTMHEPGCGEQESHVCAASLTAHLRIISGRYGATACAQSSAPCSRSNCGYSIGESVFQFPERLARVRTAARGVNGENEAKKPEIFLSRFHRIPRKAHQHRRFAAARLLKPCASFKEKASRCNRNGAARDAYFADSFAGEICGKIKVAGAADLNALPKVQPLTEGPSATSGVNRIMIRPAFCRTWRRRRQHSESAKIAVDIQPKSTTIWLWIAWIQRLRLCLIEPGGRWSNGSPVGPPPCTA